MPKRSAANSMMVPIPTMGMSSKQSISSMDPRYCPEMQNFFPVGATIDVRKGFTFFGEVSGAETPNNTFEFITEAGTRFLVCISSADIYNVSAGGAGVDISGAVVVQPTAYHAVNFRSRLFFKSEAALDDVGVWTGVGNAALAGFTGPGADDKALAFITSYKSRLYFVEHNAASFWYGGVDAITGALTEFDVTSIFRLGGKILWIGSTSFAAFANQEVFVIISEAGEVLLYQGEYPGSATWSLMGRYYIAPPPCRKAIFYWGQDVICITTQGVVPLSEVINAGPRGEYQYLTDEINTLFTADIAATVAVGATLFITGIVYPNGNYLLISLPRATAGATIQYVMNLTTRAWTKFTNQPGCSWSLFNNNLYFGSLVNHRIYKADDGYEDVVISGSFRTIKLRLAPNYLGNPALVKGQATMRPLVSMSEGLSLTADMDWDYSNTVPTSTETNLADTAYKAYQPVMGLKGQGKAGSIHIEQVITNKRMSLQAIEVTWNEGDVSIG